MESETFHFFRRVNGATSQTGYAAFAPSQTEETKLGDLTIQCYGLDNYANKPIVVHKLVLSAVSPHFAKVISECCKTQQCKPGENNSLKIRWSVSEEHQLFQRLIDLIYHGYTTICQHSNEQFYALVRRFDVHVGGEVESEAYNVTPAQFADRQIQSNHHQLQLQPSHITTCSAPQVRYDLWQGTRQTTWVGAPWAAGVLQQQGSYLGIPEAGVEKESGLGSSEETSDDGLSNAWSE